MLTYPAFLEKKEELTKVFEEAMTKALKDMDEDIKGISWFSSAPASKTYSDRRTHHGITGKRP